MSSYGRGKWTKNKFGQDMYIIDENQSSSRDPSSFPTIDKLEGKPTVFNKRKRPEDKFSLTEMLYGDKV